MRGVSGFLFLAAAATSVAMAGAAVAATIEAGAVELGVSASVVSVEGTRTTRMGLRAGRHLRVAGQHARYQARVDYVRVSDLDVADVQAELSWLGRLGDSDAWLVASAGGGLRQEWLGSFSTARYPVGASLAVKSLLGQRASFDVTWEYRRILSDPVADFNETRLDVGLSVFFSNQREP